MSTQSTPKDGHLRCLKCFKVLKCSRYDVDKMIQHVQTCHPEILEHANDKVKNLYKLAAEHGINEDRLSEISRMTGMSKQQMADEAERYLSKHKVGQEPQSSQWSAKTPRVVDSRDINKRQYYRSSIERWRPPGGCIYCPNCGCNRQPLIKSSSEFYSATSCSAACIANCWPFCFLPCLQSVDNREYLHCSNCRIFLGIYDRENGWVRPNRQFVA